jgi:hypothetical protein
MQDKRRMIKGALWMASTLCTFAGLMMIGSAGEAIAPRGAMAFTTHETDPTGDAFGVSPQHDVTDLLLSTDGTTLTVMVAFASPIGYPHSGSNEVAGYLDFDTDQDASTGVASHLAPYPECANCTALGIDYFIDLASYDS